MKRQHGFSIITAIFILVVLALLGGYMVKLSTVQTTSFNLVLQGARAYQAARSGIEWSLGRLANGGSCSDINAQTAMSFSGLSGFSVKLGCSSQSYSESIQTLTFYRVNAQAEFGAYSDAGYVSRSLEITIIK